MARLPTWLLAQLGHPRGLLAPLIGGLLDHGNRTLNLHVVGAIAPAAGERVLEIGFGGGYALRLMAHHQPQAKLAGVEISAEMRARAQARLPEADLRLGSVDALPFADRSFDAVCSSNTIYFWPDVAAGLAELYRVLVGGGRLVLGINPPERLRAQGFEARGLRVWTAEQLVAAVAQAGFEGARSRRMPDRGEGSVLVQAERGPDPVDDLDRDAAALASWASNAHPWAEAVRSGAIASRREVTDAAVLQAALEGAPATALDLGCGEGWLVRALGARGVDARGIDGTPELVDLARRRGGGRFDVVSYEALVEQPPPPPVDLVVANFALVGEQVTERVIRYVPRLLRPGGRFVLQTVHPWVVAAGEGPYLRGWRPGSWDGFGGGFSTAADWYFRTVADWVGLLTSAGLQVDQLREPAGADHRPRSLLLVAARRSRWVSSGSSSRAARSAAPPAGACAWGGARGSPRAGRRSRGGPAACATARRRRSSGRAARGSGS